jgi:hypothetical protein
MNNFFVIHLLQSSTRTCFDQYLPHLQEFLLNQYTGRSLTESDDTKCCINTIWPLENEQDISRNMYRITINVFKKNCASSWSMAKSIMSLSQWHLSVQSALFYKLWSSDGTRNSCRPRGNGVPLQCRQAARKTLIKGKWHAESLLKLLLLLLRSE